LFSNRQEEEDDLTKDIDEIDSLIQSTVKPDNLGPMSNNDSRNFSQNTMLSKVFSK